MSREPCLNADGTPKRLFYSERRALREARLTRSNGPDPEAIHAYRCPASRGRVHWHVGNSYAEHPPWQ